MQKGIKERLGGAAHPTGGGAGVYGDAETGLRWEGVFPVFRTGG